jgi:hypothetical protein
VLIGIWVTTPSSTAGATGAGFGGAGVGTITGGDNGPRGSLHESATSPSAITGKWYRQLVI